VDTIAALREGDTIIFDQVYYQYHEKIYFYVLGKTRSRYIAEETTQITFIKLWQYRHNLSHEYALFTQIFRIARTTMIDVLRKQENASRKQVSYDPQAGSGNSVWQRITERELEHRIEVAVRKMPDMRRQVFEMSRSRGMSYKEIACELSISVKTVETHISQALKQLKQLLGGALFLFILLFFQK
jgi:RNA polymerase sigma-70 factor (family 1)